jgi:hypothetical protein
LRFSHADLEELMEMVGSWKFVDQSLRLDYTVSPPSNRIRLIPINDWVQLIGNATEVIGLRRREDQALDWKYQWLSSQVLPEIESELMRFLVPGPFVGLQIIDRSTTVSMECWQPPTSQSADNQAAIEHLLSRPNAGDASR